MCEHLKALDDKLKRAAIKETFRGQAWSDNCREWVYYNVVLDLPALRNEFNFPAFIIDHVNDDPRSGQEKGFVCTKCNDAVMGKYSD